MPEIIITIIATIVLPVLLWYYTPQELKDKLHTGIKRTSNNKTTKYNQFIEGLQKNNVILSNDNILSSEFFIEKKRYVYFPVVPRQELNIIHLTFSKVIKNLENLGLHVIIFIFDDYYGRVKNLNCDVRKEHISNFVESLRKLGITGNIIYESKVYNDKKYIQKFLKNYLDLTSIFTVKEIKELNSINKYILDNTKHIRYEKVFLNIAHLMCLPYKFGYVLSGADETKMWQDFIKKYEERRNRIANTEVVLLSIPKVYNIKGEVSNVLDTSSFSYTNNTQTIKKMIGGNLENKSLIRKDCGIFYVLNNIYFEEKSQLMLTISNSDIKTFKNIDEFVSYCVSNDVSKNEFLINSLCDILSKIYHNVDL